MMRSKGAGEGANEVAEALMGPFVFYTVITALNLLIFAPNRLRSTQNSHQAHQATRLPGHQASFWVGPGLAYHWF